MKTGPSAYGRDRLVIFGLALGLAGIVLPMGFSSCAHSRGDPTVKILEPANGATVTGPDVVLRIETANFSGHHHYDADAAGMVSAPTGGHIHVYIDQPVTTDAAKDTLFEGDGNTLTLKSPKLAAAGSHYIIVQGADDNHKNYPTMRDSVMFTVSP